MVLSVTDALENSDAYTATQDFEAFLDDLSNWYVRRSRRRYWKSERDADKDTAYATLWHVLVKLSRTLAPLIPFITEKMYQNLVRNVFDDTSTELGASAYESIHHTDWPQADTDVIDEARIEQMSLARRAASLGLSARSSAGIKVRQPLSKVLVHVKEGWAELEREYVDILADELNVKEFEFVEDADALLSYKVFPVNKLLGPKYGADFPKVRAALNELDPDEVAAKVTAEEPVTLDVDGESVTLEPEEIMVKTEAGEGLSTAEDNLLTVAIDTTITPELRAEGLAREIVRRVQAQRKEADFNIEDRITTWYQAEAELAEIFEQWGEYIKDETLTTELIAGDPSEGAYVETHEIDGQNITIGVRQN